MQSNKHIVQIIFAIAFCAIVSVGFSHVAHAQTQPYTYQPLATVPIGNGTVFLTNGTANNSVNPVAYIQNLYVFAFSAGIVIAVVSGVWSGLEYMMSESVTNKSNALGRIKNVGWGFALLLCSYLLLDLINPQLVNFNLNLGNVGNGNLVGDAQTQQDSLNVLASQSATNAATAQIASQTAQQQVTTLQNQIGLCADMQTDPSVSASSLTQAGCDDAGMKNLNTQLTQAQTNAQQAATAAATAAATQQAQTQAVVDGAKATVTSLRTQLTQAQATLSAAQTPAARAAAQSTIDSLNQQITTAQANVIYQQQQQNLANSTTQAEAALANGDTSVIQALQSAISNQKMNISTLANQDTSANSTGLENTLQSENTALNTESTDLTSLQENITAVKSVTDSAITSIQKSSPAFGATPQAYVQSLLGQYSQTTLTSAANNVISTPGLQTSQQAYINQQNTNIQNAIMQQCVTTFGSNNAASCSSAGGASGSW